MVVRHIGLGERGQGCHVEPCPLKSALFREAEGQPVRREGTHRLPRDEGMFAEFHGLDYGIIVRSLLSAVRRIGG